MLPLVLCLFLVTLGQITITPLVFDREIHSVVESNDWVFYSFDVPAGQAFLLNVLHGSKYDLDVYVRKGNEVPNRVDKFDYSATGFEPNITIQGLAEASPTHYIAGVYGIRGETVPFSIKVTLSNGCVQDCSGHGSCVRGTCSCFEGWAGDACSSAVARIQMDIPVGPFRLANGEWRFFSLYVARQENLELFVQKPNGGDVDVYLRRASLPTLFDYDYADVSRESHGGTSFSVNISALTAGTWYIGVFGFSDVSLTLTIKTEKGVCANQCSLHGLCTRGSCACNSGYRGVSCQELSFPANFDMQYTGYVGANSWNYYQVVSRSLNSLVITTDHAADGSDCDVYVRPNAQPTLTQYTLRNVTMDNHIVLVVPSPGDTPYWVGIYGYSSCTYRLKFTREAADHCECGRFGSCSNGRCVCNPGYAGEHCHLSAPFLPNDQLIQYTINQGQWIYYSFRIAATHQFVVVVKETSTVGQIQLYVAMGTYPSLDYYNAVDKSTNQPYHRISFRFGVAYNGTFMFGLYRPSSGILAPSAPFMITAYQIPF